MISSVLENYGSDDDTPRVPMASLFSPKLPPALKIIACDMEAVDSNTNPMVKATSPIASPSMTERRGIQLRIHVIPPEGSPYVDEGDTSDGCQLTKPRFYEDNPDNAWSPPASRLSSCSDGSTGSSTHSGSSSCSSQKHLLCLPSSSEFSPSYFSSSKGSYYYQPNRRDSSCSFSSGGGTGASGDGNGAMAMSLSPSSQSIGSCLSVSTNTGTFDGSLSPYCLSPTISRPPSSIGWRNRANTTVNQPSFQAVPRGSAACDSNTEVDSNVSGGSLDSIQFRTSRSWTFSSGNRGRHQFFSVPNEHDSSFDDGGLTWTPPVNRSTSPHPLGYYSDSPSPFARSVSPSFSLAARSNSSTRSPLLQWKMATTDVDDPALAPPPSAHLAHRTSIGGAVTGGRRFSVSVHQPHSHMPLAQQMHYSHLLAQHQQQSSYSLFPPSVSCNQRRRGSAATYSLLPSCTIWDPPPSGNLSRLRRLGHSCPQLSSLAGLSTAASNVGGQFHYRSGAGPVVKLRRDIAVQRRHSNRLSRRSFNANTSPISAAGSTPPVCHSGRSPLRNVSPNINAETSPGRPCVRQSYSNQAAAPHRRNSLRVQCHDTRRWSVTSLPSSGYGTPGSSAVSSQYSSQERLAAALEEQRRRYDSNDSNPCNPADCYLCESASQMRLRSRSLSSIAWLNLSSSRLDSSLKLGEENAEVALRNNVYKERFPKAKRQMEEKLEAFLAENSLISSSETTANPSCPVPPSSTNQSVSSVTKSSESGSGSSFTLAVPTGGAASPRRTSLTPPVVATDAASLKLLSDGSARFIHHQIMELAMDCLQRCTNDALSSAYFCEFSQNLEELLEEAKEKAGQDAVEQLSGLVKTLLLIVSRSARLLECLEFDPEEFYRVLHEAEGHAKEAQRQGQGIGVDFPQYIIRQLGLNRGGLEDLHGCLTQSSDSGNIVDTPTRGATATSVIQPATVTALSSPNVSRRSAPPKETDFDIIKLVSNGAYGAVFLVRHRETRRRFALKKLSKSNLMLRNQIDQVYAERDILTFTDNPFVVSFYGSFETKRHLCMVMEYVEGGDCATLLKSIGVLPVEMARLYIAETALAIEYLHAYGIVHRDLKPDNLLITAFGHIKLTDFGLSKIGLMNRTNLMYEGYFDALMSETTQFQDRQICGTPEYIAPEVILRQGYGKPVDWWALGVILYEFLVGTVPFFGDTPEQLFSHVINDAIEWPEEPYAPPEDARDLVSALLQQNSLQRLGTVNGAIELKEHRFFSSLDWNSLLRQKAEFIPQLEGEDDTSYFDTRADRYQHDLDSGDDEQKGADSELASTAPVWPVTKGSPFASFSSSSPRYSLLAEERDQRSGDSSVGSLERSDASNISAGTSENAGGRNEMPLEPAVTAPTASRGGKDSPAQPKTTRPNSTRSHVDTDSTKGSSTQLRKNDAVAKRDSGSVLPDSPSCTDRAQHHLLSAGNTEVKWRRKSDVGPASQKRDLSLSRDASGQVHYKDAATHVMKESSRVQPERPEPSPRSIVPKPIPGAYPQDSSSKPVPSPRPSVGIQQSHSSAATGLSSGKHSHASLANAQKQHPDIRLAVPTDSCSASASAATTSISPTCSSAASSRDPSPIRGIRRRSSTSVAGGNNKEFAPIINKLKPPVVIRRGIKGFGFTIRAIRVYIGETDYYTIQHLVSAVESGSPACDAGLRPNDLLTHINGESVKNLTHTEVVQRLMTSGETITLRVSPLESTTIRQGGPARKTAGKLAKRKPAKHKFQKRQAEKGEKRRSSILRRLSGKRGSFEAGAALSGDSQQLESSALPNLTELAALQRSVSNSDGSLLNPSLLKLAGERLPGSRRASGTSSSHRGSNSSRSNDSTSSVEISPGNEGSVEKASSGSTSHRPSSFFGLRNKVAQTLCPKRQASETMQLSPLARAEGGNDPSGNAPCSTSGTNAGQITSSLKASAALLPTVQKKPLAKTKNSDTSTCSEVSSSSHGESSQINRSRRNTNSIFDSGGNSSSAKSKSSFGK